MKRKALQGFTLIELAIVIAIIGILAAVAVPKFTDLTKSAEGSVARSLLQSLQTSSAIYVAQQKLPPVNFSNFVSTGATTGAQTLSLLNVNNRLSGAPAGIGSATMTLTFQGGGSATYYMDGTDIWASYSAGM